MWVQVIAYLAGLQVSRLYKPSLVICPATVLRQWMRELRIWHPPFRCAHASQHQQHQAMPASIVGASKAGTLPLSVH